MRPELDNLPQPNWFHHGAQILDLLELYYPVECVELGSNQGCSSIAIARLIRQWGGRLTCVDLWSQYLTTPSTVDRGEFEANIKRAELSDTIRIVQADTRYAALHWDGAEIDFLYVDADHSFEGCTSDLETWWPWLRVGGLIAGDDYDDVSGNPRDGVTHAWDEFERRHQQQFQRSYTTGHEPVGRLIWGVKR